MRLSKGMSKYRILVLTDHSGHSAENSLYALVRSMIQHELCEHVLVSSRGISDNAGFFAGDLDAPLYAVEASEDFAYDADGLAYQHVAMTVDLEAIDAVFLRLPRPVEDDFLLALPALFHNATFINNPNGIVATSSKEFLLHFPTVTTDTILVRSTQEVVEIAVKMDLVLKPLRDYGGRGVIKIQGGRVDDGASTYHIATYLPRIASELQDRGYIAMRYLKNVTQGDKRILVVEGQILAASLRLPAPDKWLCNVAQGGTSVAAEVDEVERQIIETITPKLLQAGILMYGADTLVDDDGKRVLSEVNVLSIGGFPQAEKQTGRPIVRQVIDSFFNYIVNTKTANV